MSIDFRLPTKETTFEIDVIGEKSKGHFKGVFTYRKLNLGQARAARCAKTRYMEDLKNLDPETTVLCEAVSWLAEGLVKAPPWWGNPWDLDDYNVVMEVYRKVIDFENNFSEQVTNIGEKVTDSDLEDSEEEEEVTVEKDE